MSATTTVIAVDPQGRPVPAPLAAAVGTCVRDTAPPEPVLIDWHVAMHVLSDGSVERWERTTTADGDAIWVSPLTREIADG